MGGQLQKYKKLYGRRECSRKVVYRSVPKRGTSVPRNFQQGPAILTAVADQACLFGLNLLKVGVSFPPGLQALRAVPAVELRLGDGQVALPATEQVRGLILEKQQVVVWALRHAVSGPGEDSAVKVRPEEED